MSALRAGRTVRNDYLVSHPFGAVGGLGYRGARRDRTGRMNTSSNLPHLQEALLALPHERHSEFLNQFIGSLSCKVSVEDWDASIDLIKRTMARDAEGGAA